MVPNTFVSEVEPLALETIDSSERRGWDRYVCQIDGKCQPVTALEAGNRWPIQTLDVSAGGVRLRMSRRFEPGTLLAVTLAAQIDDEISMPLARVCRVEVAGHHWELGCVWADELEHSEMRLLLPLVNWAKMGPKKG